MATVWLLEEGKIQRGHVGEKPLDWLVSHLGLRVEGWIAPHLTEGQTGPALIPYRGMRFAIAEITPDDLRGKIGEWEPGFYLLNVSAQEAKSILERES